MRYDLLHPKAFRAALVEHMGPEYPVPQERQVRRWIGGDTPMPGWARRAADEIVGIQKEAPPGGPDGALMERWLSDEPPAWVAPLVDQIIREIRANRATIVAALAREVTRQTLEGNGSLLKRTHDALTRVEHRLAEEPQPKPRTRSKR